MGNLLFSPSGRIGPGEFMSGALALIIIGVVLGVLPIFVPALAILGILGFVIIWCWIVIWVKRYHDGGKSGWMCLVPIIVWFVIGMIIGTILPNMFPDPEATEIIEAATEAGDFATIFKYAMSGGMTKTGQLVNLGVGAVVSYLVAMLFNNMIKHDAHDNQFGPEAGTS